MSALICPVCRSADCDPFYKADSVPTNSCLLISDRDTALSFPTGDIELAVCGGCGFIFNAAWDAQHTVYSDQYEETQGFSATFNRFNRNITEYLIDRYDVRHKTVLEIGCGKGEFLSLICELGGNQGIGYDPSFVPARQRADQNVRFVPAFFTSETREIPPDLLCCKMTLEHIGQPRPFLSAVRAVMTRTNSVAFFQIPDVGRILNEAAFWDVYYEHCAYFSATSLRRLFLQAGFMVERVWTGYDDQYLMIVARPIESASQMEADGAEEIQAIVKSAHRFAASVGPVRAAWLRRIRDWSDSGCRTVLWGSGSKAVAFLTTLGLHTELDYVVDINPYRVGKYLPGTGQKVVSPDFLATYRPDNVIIMNPVYREEIARELEGQGCSPDIYAIVDAQTQRA